MSEESFPTDIIGYGYRTTLEHSTTVLRTKTGREFTRQNWNHPLRRFIVPLEAMSDAERQEVLDFVEDMAGAADTFYFTDPVASTTHRCRFASDSATIETRFFETHYWPDLEIREVLE